MEELSLFDFDFSGEENSFEDKKAVFETLLDYFKELRNPYTMNIEYLPLKVKTYLDNFEAEGWIKIEQNRIEIKHQYIKFHTVEELADEYQAKMDHWLNKPDVCWYNDILQVRNFFGPIRFKDKNDQKAFYLEKNRITKEAAKQLGLNHFINKPSSRGHKMSPFDSKWTKEHVLPTIVEHVISITDIDEMYQFFREHTFFFGRRDWNWDKSPVQTAPYAEYRAFLPTEFDLACLCEAKDLKTVKLIMDYQGSAFGGDLMNRKIIYPNGWSYERYEATLTDEDKELIKKDKERLARLHGEIYNA